MVDHESFPKVLEGDLTCKNVLDRTIPQTHEVALEVFYIIQFCKLLS